MNYPVSDILVQQQEQRAIVEQFNEIMHGKYLASLPPEWVHIQCKFSPLPKLPLPLSGSLPSGLQDPSGGKAFAFALLPPHLSS